MRMLLYAGASNEDIKTDNICVHPTLRLKAEGQELLPEKLVGKTFRVIKNNDTLGLIIEEVNEYDL